MTLVFPNLEAELKRKNIKRADLAQLLKCSIGTISEKMNEVSPFTFDAAVTIKKFLGVNIPLEELFASDNVIADD